MVNRSKVITMTKMALYDKHQGEEDRQINTYFRHDYIYRQNLWTRICVGMGSLIWVGLYWLRLVFIDGLDIFVANLQGHVVNSVLFVIAVLAFYSLVGTIQSTRRYYLVQKRLDRYRAMTQHLARINERTRRQPE